MINEQLTNFIKQQLQKGLERKIISDQLIELVDIYVDDIKLPDWFKYLGIYTYNNQELPRATIWGCNGSWHWEFKMPMITWIIDKKFEHAEKFNPPEIPQVILAEEKLKTRRQMALSNFSEHEHEVQELMDKVKEKYGEGKVNLTTGQLS